MLRLLHNWGSQRSEESRRSESPARGDPLYRTESGQGTRHPRENCHFSGVTTISQNSSPFTKLLRITEVAVTPIPSSQPSARLKQAHS